MQQRDQNYTLDRLATDIKHSKKSIYKYFGSKISLIEEVFRTHREYVRLQFERIDSEHILEIDKLFKYIYLVDDSIKQIRLSRWYHQAKPYNKIKEHYFILRTEVYEPFLLKGLYRYEQKLAAYQITPESLADYVLSSIEHCYFQNNINDIKAEENNPHTDHLIFTLHGCLISLEDV
ncbi:hypothetical protein [Croceiramulus getboli]|nr:TetR/AcrR family transcriptional regulator [Flavobacteriaceae bacterium YJPT1-3]